MFEAQRATLPRKEAYTQGSSLRKTRRYREASNTTNRACRGRDCPGFARVLPKSGLGTSGVGNRSTYEWAWLIGAIRENYFREMLVEGQSAKYLRLENIALYGS